MTQVGKNEPSDVRQLRLASIDALRGLAVLGVVSVHCVGAYPSGVAPLDLAMKLGRYGVQLFFLASAVTMMMMWEARRDSDEHPVRSFYIRRMARILPMFWVAIPVYVALNGTGPQYYAPDGIGAVAIVLTALTQHGWWPTTINSVVPGGWSIAVEMTFYMLFPLLLGLFSSAQRTVWGLVLFSVAGLLAKWTYAQFLLARFPGFSHELLSVFFGFWFPRQIVFFFCGVLVFRAWKQELPAPDWRVLSSVAVGLAALYLGLGRGDTLVALALALAVYIVLRHSLSLGWLSALGQRSYSIYLCHFLVLEAIARFVPATGGVDPLRLVGVWFCLVAGAYLMAGFTKRFVEDPGIAIGRALIHQLQLVDATRAARS